MHKKYYYTSTVYLQTLVLSRSVGHLKALSRMYSMCVVVDIECIKELVHHAHKTCCLRSLVSTSESECFGDRLTQNLELCK